MRWDDFNEKERLQIAERVWGGESIDSVALEIDMPQRNLERRLRELAQYHKAKQGKIKPANFKEHWKLYCELINRDAKQAAPVLEKKPNKFKTSRRVVVLCDLHGWPHPSVVEKALAEKPDILVLDGDLLDAHAFSHYPKTGIAPINEELARVRGFIEAALKIVPEIIISRGNHDDRIHKYFIERISTEFMPLIRWDILEMMVMGLERVIIVDNQYTYVSPMGTTAGELSNEFIVFLGDAVIGHAGVTRAGDGQSAMAFWQWYDRQRHAYKWVEAAVLIQAHSHRAGVLYPMGGHLVLVDGGFAGMVGKQGGQTGPLTYSHEFGNVKYPPPVLGYTTFSQVCKNGQWKTDKSSVRFILV